MSRPGDRLADLSRRFHPHFRLVTRTGKSQSKWERTKDGNALLTVRECAEVEQPIQLPRREPGADGACARTQRGHDGHLGGLHQPASQPTPTPHPCRSLAHAPSPPCPHVCHVSTRTAHVGWQPAQCSTGSTSGQPHPTWPPKSPEMPRVEPQLKPYQPNHRINTPCRQSIAHES